MRINAISPNQGFKKTPPFIPTFTNKHVKTTALLLGSYVAGSVATLLIERLVYLAWLNRFYHDEIGVYRQDGGMLWRY